MNLLHTSDWHLGRMLYGRKRYEEFTACGDWLQAVINEREIEVLIVAGDSYDTTTPSNKAQALYYRFLSRLSNTPCRHVVIVGGNHDSPSFLEAPKALLEHLNIHIIGAAQSQRNDEVLLLKDPQGQLELIAWIGTEPDVPYNRDDFLTMIYSAWLKSPPQVVVMFEARLAALDRVMEQIQSAMAVVLADFPESLSDPSNWRFYRYNLQHRRLLQVQTEQTWCRTMMYQLQKHIS